MGGCMVQSAAKEFSMPSPQPGPQPQFHGGRCPFVGCAGTIVPVASAKRPAGVAHCYQCDVDPAHLMEINDIG
jgi:hypothetical protein